MILEKQSISITNFKQKISSKFGFDGLKGEEEAIEFLIDSSISDKYDLTKDSYKGKEFKVTYKTVTEFDKYDEEIDLRTITKLELIE